MGLCGSVSTRLRTFEKRLYHSGVTLTDTRFRPPIVRGHIGGGYLPLVTLQLPPTTALVATDRLRTTGLERSVAPP